MMISYIETPIGGYMVLELPCCALTESTTDFYVSISICCEWKCSCCVNDDF